MILVGLSRWIFVLPTAIAQFVRFVRPDGLQIPRVFVAARIPRGILAFALAEIFCWVLPPFMISVTADQQPAFIHRHGDLRSRASRQTG
jgi:hypothetical protein